MTYQHKELAAGRWKKMSFCEQMANVGSEIERAFNWREKRNQDYSQKALERALELLELTIDSVPKKSYLKELTRLREIILDFFMGRNIYNTTASSLKKYFYYFGVSVRKNSA